jgi:short-subunit dehydrogenase
MQRIFLTGASSGIGAGLARHYARPGAVLGLVARRAELLESLAGELRAGVGIRNALREGNAEDVARLVQINVIGVTNTVVPFVPALLAQGSGVLCAVSSVAGHRALPGRAAYSSSKRAVTTFMDGLRMDLHGTGVHAMTICPGFVRTPMTDGMKGMLFLVELDDAVRQMAGAIEARRNTFTFPWQIRALRRVLALAPEWLLRRAAPPPRERSGAL